MTVIDTYLGETMWGYSNILFCLKIPSITFGIISGCWLQPLLWCFNVDGLFPSFLLYVNCDIFCQQDLFSLLFFFSPSLPLSFPPFFLPSLPLSYERDCWAIGKYMFASISNSLVFPILLFSSISLHWSLRKTFLSLFATLWDSVFKWLYFSFSPLLFTSLLFTAICNVSSDNHFAFLHFCFLGMVLITASWTMSRTSVYSSSGILSIRSNPLNLFVTSTVQS